MSIILLPLDYLAIYVFHRWGDLLDVELMGILIIAPIVGYIDQLVRMLKTKDAGTFRVESALILLTSNLLRFIYAWYRHLQDYLLGQSISIFVVQYILALLSLYYGNKPQHPFRGLKQLLMIHESRNISDFIVSSIVYVLVLLFLVRVGLLWFAPELFLEIVLLVSNIIDVFVSVPNFLRVVFKGDISGCSLVIIVQYLIGDVFKLLMYTFAGTQFAFILGAILQTTIDTTVAVGFFSKKKHIEDEYSLASVQ